MVDKITINKASLQAYINTLEAEIVELEEEKNTLRAERNEMINVAGEAIGTDPSLRSSACVTVLAHHAEWLKAELSDLRAERDLAITELGNTGRKLGEAQAEIDRLKETVKFLENSGGWVIPPDLVNLRARHAALVESAREVLKIIDSVPGVRKHAALHKLKAALAEVKG